MCWAILPVLALAFLFCGGVNGADLERQLERIQRGDFQRAVQEIRPLALQGDPRAQYLLGTIYLNGYVDPPSAGDAAKWIKKAAEQGLVPAQTELARMYGHADGVERDIAKTAHWYERAAEQGDVGAQLFIADAYAFGSGISPDRVQAYKWYQIAMQYWGSLAVRARDAVAAQMTPEEVALAKRHAAEWLKNRDR